ncbi:MAG: PRTRC system ThiF family protein [Sulfuritalea sp.]|nr:PRTRC system ThiF family protein [Sulfuritalea sp.]
MEKFTIPNRWLTAPVAITVVGAGGTGSQMVKGLAKLHLALLSLGHPGIKVTLWDDDRVSPANLGRQEFYAPDVGHPKSTVLIHRVNMTLGTQWRAIAARFQSTAFSSEHLIIGCVDTRASRKAILDGASRRGCFWMDLGNRADDGQVVFGQIPGFGDKKTMPRLPHAADLFPEIVDDTLDAGDNEPSCSLADALEKQSLFVNSMAATWGLNLLWQLFRHGEITQHGYFFNLKTGRSNPLPINPQVWKAMGFSPRARRKKAA